MSAPLPVFSPAKRTRASTDVVAQIRAAIFSGQLQPGDRLPTERDLALQFGVSRVTIRDALRSLETSGLILVKTGAQGGPYVAEPDISTLSDSLGTHLLRSGTTFREVAEARIALETTAARLACERATAEDLAALRSTLPDADRSRDEASAMSLEFHEVLVHAAHNRALLSMYQATRALIDEAFDTLRTRWPGIAEASRAVHEKLYEAVEAKDADRAVALMREHLYDFMERADRLQGQLGSAWQEIPGARR